MTLSAACSAAPYQRQGDRTLARLRAAVAAQLSPAVGIPVPTLEVALKRQSYGIKPIDPAALAEQQKIADAFGQLSVLPAPIKVADAARPAP